MRLVSRLYLYWTLLLLIPLSLSAQDAPAVINTPLDSAAVDSEGDELEELDDIDVRASQLPECLAGLFSHDTLVLGCELDLLPNKIIVRTKDGAVLAKGITNFSSDEAGLIAHHKSGDLTALLGCDAEDEIVHRNNLVLL